MSSPVDMPCHVSGVKAPNSRQRCARLAALGPHMSVPDSAPPVPLPSRAYRRLAGAERESKCGERVRGDGSSQMDALDGFVERGMQGQGARQADWQPHMSIYGPKNTLSSVSLSNSRSQGHKCHTKPHSRVLVILSRGCNSTQQGGATGTICCPASEL